MDRLRGRDSETEIDLSLSETHTLTPSLTQQTYTTIAPNATHSLPVAMAAYITSVPFVI